MAFKQQSRQYQTEAAYSVFDYFAVKTGNPLVAMPTGTGKSVVIAMLLQMMLGWYPTTRVIVTTHVKELIQQNFEKLLAIWPQAPAGVYSAGLDRRDTAQKIIFAGIASVAKRAAEFGFVSLLFIDEAHLVNAQEATLYALFIDELRKINPMLKVVGFTATPWRAGQGKLTEAGLFTDFCFDITGFHAFNRLLDEGYLCPLVPRPTAAVLKTDGVHMRGGDFIASELQAAENVTGDAITRQALEETCQLAADRSSWLLFCAGVDHAVLVADMLTDMGVPCKAVHNKMADPDGRLSKEDYRDWVIAGWKACKWHIATNNMMTTGVDHPGLDCIVMLRPTGSTNLWVQMLGRGTRPLYAEGWDLDSIEGRLAAIFNSQKRDCLVLDFARNSVRLGPINDPVLPRKKGEKAGEAPIKLCMSCSTYNHATARACFCCGAEFPVYGPKITASASDVQLIKPSEAPVVTDFKVDHVTYNRHEKMGKPPSVRVSYYCGLKMFQEYVAFEHNDPFSQRRARDWWHLRQPGGARVDGPASTAQALQLVPYLKAPTHLRVWVNKKYPDILACCFDGSNFGAQAPNAQAPDTDVVASPPPMAAASAPAVFDDMDDDIPF